MATIHVVIWFTWFLAWNWLQHVLALAKEWTLKGVDTMKKIKLFLLPLLLIAGLFVVLPKTAVAQDQDIDPPGRVARLSFIQGTVSYQPSGETDWVEANPNRPITIGDNLWADKDSRGELHIGSTAIRIGSETGLSFLNLDDRTVQIQLAQGVTEIHLRRMESGDAFEVDTPNLAITLTRSGEYLISTDPDNNSTVVTVREGAAQATGGGESYDLEAGQQYILTGTDQLTFDGQNASGFDGFEDWCQTRDQRENSSVSARYVSRDVDGVYDLDDNGDWQDVPEYGQIWVPRGVEVGWTPYRFGHWVWIAPWGWTWVEAEPWGFAPFHYGRWAFISGYWGWVPGPIVVRPVYAPALVAFVGGNGGLSVSIGFGGGFSGVAWFPLGPRDVWVPGYRCSPRYVQNVNITNTRVVNVTQVTNVYNNYTRNVTVANNYTYAHNNVAVTAVSRETFVNARPVAAASVRVTSQQLESARVLESAPMAPIRTSRISSEAKPAMARPAVAFSQRPVVARLAPPNPVRNERPQPEMNGTRPSNQGAQPSRPNNAEPAPRNNAEPQPARPNTMESQPARPNNQEPPPNRDGFKPFTPPANEHQNAQPRPEPQAEPRQQQPPVRFTPPAKAKEQDYDVHPPLNQKPAEQPKEQNRQEKPAPKPESKPQKPDKPHGR